MPNRQHELQTEITKSSRDPATRKLLLVLMLVATIALVSTGVAVFLGWDKARQEARAGQNLAAQVQAACQDFNIDTEELKYLCDKAEEVEKTSAGPTGPPGPPGQPGRDGTDGTDGTDGKPGPKGDPGDSGTDGKNGSNGSNGQDGAPGVPGPPGPAGQDGKDGDKGDKGDKGDPGPTCPEGYTGTEVLIPTPTGEYLIYACVKDKEVQP